MAEGGIYDQLEGGFHRYSVDQVWLVPHFEKMLYDNALLIPLYLAAWRLTGDELFRRIAAETCNYLLSGLQTPDGAFFASTDADSEGVEGKYFVWTRDELLELLPADDAEIACRYWGVDIGGNFEGQTILNVVNEAGSVARWLNISEQDLNASLQRSRQTLLAQPRSPHPAGHRHQSDHRLERPRDRRPGTGRRAAWRTAIHRRRRARGSLHPRQHAHRRRRTAAHPRRRPRFGAGLPRGLRRARRRLPLALRSDRRRGLVRPRSAPRRGDVRALLGRRARRVLRRRARRRGADRPPQADPGRRNAVRQRRRRARDDAALRAHRRGPLGRPRRVLTPRLQRLPGTRPHDAGRLRQRARLARTAPHGRRSSAARTTPRCGRCSRSRAAASHTRPL